MCFLCRVFYVHFVSLRMGNFSKTRQSICSKKIVGALGRPGSLEGAAEQHGRGRSGRRRPEGAGAVALDEAGSVPWDFDGDGLEGFLGWFFVGTGR